MSKPEYPPYIVTDAAKRLWDEGILCSPEEMEKQAQKRKQARQKANPTQLIKGYKFNGFRNRSQRRFAAKRAGYLHRNDQGLNGWSLYKAPLGGNVQTVIGGGR